MLCSIVVKYIHTNAPIYTHTANESDETHTNHAAWYHVELL